MAAKTRGGSFAILPTIAGPGSAAVAGTAMVVCAGVILGDHLPSHVMLAVAVVAGLPHGASDMAVGRSALRASGAGWWRRFLLGYLGLVAATLTAWALAPAAMLAAFLLLSVVHFGMQDAPDRSWPAVLAHGGAPIVLPALFHRHEVERLFAFLIGDHAPAPVAAVAGPVAAAWLAAIALMLWRRVEDRERSPHRPTWPALADLLLIGLLFAAAPPLVAFSLYFAVLHTPRALRGQRRRIAEPAPARQTAALTAIACLLGLALFLRGPGLTPEAAIVRTSFMLLSALTVPHMALEYLASSASLKKRRGLGGRPAMASVGHPG